MTKEVIIPNGLVHPSDITVIEIPTSLQHEETVVAAEYATGKGRRVYALRKRTNYLTLRQKFVNYSKSCYDRIPTQAWPYTSSQTYARVKSGRPIRLDRHVRSEPLNSRNEFFVGNYPTRLEKVSKIPYISEGDSKEVRYIHPCHSNTFSSYAESRNQSFIDLPSSSFETGDYGNVKTFSYDIRAMQRSKKCACAESTRNNDSSFLNSTQQSSNPSNCACYGTDESRQSSRGTPCGRAVSFQDHAPANNGTYTIRTESEFSGGGGRLVEPIQYDSSYGYPGGYVNLPGSFIGTCTNENTDSNFGYETVGRINSHRGPSYMESTRINPGGSSGYFDPSFADNSQSRSFSGGGARRSRTCGNSQGNTQTSMGRTYVKQRSTSPSTSSSIRPVRFNYSSRKATYGDSSRFPDSLGESSVNPEGTDERIVCPRFQDSPSYSNPTGSDSLQADVARDSGSTQAGGGRSRTQRRINFTNSTDVRSYTSPGTRSAKGGGGRSEFLSSTRNDLSGMNNTFGSGNVSPIGRGGRRDFLSSTMNDPNGMNNTFGAGNVSPIGIGSTGPIYSNSSRSAQNKTYTVPCPTITGQSQDESMGLYSSNNMDYTEYLDCPVFGGSAINSQDVSLGILPSGYMNSTRNTTNESLGILSSGVMDSSRSTQNRSSNIPACTCENEDFPPCQCDPNVSGAAQNGISPNRSANFSGNAGPQSSGRNNTQEGSLGLLDSGYLESSGSTRNRSANLSCLCDPNASGNAQDESLGLLDSGYLESSGSTRNRSANLSCLCDPNTSGNAQDESLGLLDSRYLDSSGSTRNRSANPSCLCSPNASGNAQDESLGLLDSRYLESSGSTRNRSANLSCLCDPNTSGNAQDESLGLLDSRYLDSSGSTRNRSANPSCLCSPNASGNAQDESLGLLSSGYLESSGSTRNKSANLSCLCDPNASRNAQDESLGLLDSRYLESSGSTRNRSANPSCLCSPNASGNAQDESLGLLDSRYLESSGSTRNRSANLSCLCDPNASGNAQDESLGLLDSRYLESSGSTQNRSANLTCECDPNSAEHTQDESLGLLGSGYLESSGSTQNRSANLSCMCDPNETGNTEEESLGLLNSGYFDTSGSMQNRSAGLICMCDPNGSANAQDESLGLLDSRYLNSSGGSQNTSQANHPCACDADANGSVQDRSAQNRSGRNVSAQTREQNNRSAQTRRAQNRIAERSTFANPDCACDLYLSTSTPNESLGLLNSGVFDSSGDGTGNACICNSGRSSPEGSLRILVSSFLERLEDRMNASANSSLGMIGEESGTGEDDCTCPFDPAHPTQSTQSTSTGNRRNRSLYLVRRELRVVDRRLQTLENRVAELETQGDGRSTRKVVIPRGMVNPDETTIIEIPPQLHSEPIVVAKKKAQNRSECNRPKCDYTSQSSKVPEPSYSYATNASQDFQPAFNSTLQTGHPPPRGQGSSKTQGSKNMDETEQMERQELEKILEEFQRARRRLIQSTSHMTKSPDSGGG